MRIIAPIYTVIATILVLSCPLNAQPIDNNDFILAKKSFQDEFYEVAARTFEKFISENPHSPDIIEAQLLLGESFVHLERFNDAVGQLDVVIATEDSGSFKGEAVYWKAEIYFKTRDFEKARELYNRILTELASSKYALYAE